MSDSVSTVARINRNDLEKFLPNQRAVKAFEDLQTQVMDTIPAAIGTNTESNASTSDQLGALIVSRPAAPNEALMQTMHQLLDAIQVQRNALSQLSDLQRQVNELRSIILAS